MMTPAAKARSKVSLVKIKDARQIGKHKNHSFLKAGVNVKKNRHQNHHQKNMT